MWNRPEVQDLAGHDAGLGGFPLGQVIQKEFAVADHGIGPLPPFLHPGGLGDLQVNSDHIPCFPLPGTILAPQASG